ncbi:uncharacterized protein EI90DRAFT_3132437 [Cantharellus anzutake]|uniref:uncharacterized protein n=1 Tax=Cantharellus anzutake TaxID=1750568 RepID=UPI0019067647|nr:uncharacterized protein EI90DRAFT_3132437 [Cantharellus anzutake]KAF8319564.1 hypothetical protein EI90DRAFT_3132437 [Cantharellus anzutake]
MKLTALTSLASVSVSALLDSGATGNFISPEFIRKHNLETTQLPQPIPVCNVDGTPNENGAITEELEALLTFGRHTEQARGTLVTLIGIHADSKWFSGIAETLSITSASGSLITANPLISASGSNIDNIELTFDESESGLSITAGPSISAYGSNIEPAFEESGSGLFLQQPNSDNSEPDVFLAPPLPGFVNFEAIQPDDDGVAEDEDGSQTSSNEKSDSSSIDIDSGPAPLDKADFQARPSSTVLSPIPLVHSIPRSGSVDENSPDPFLSQANTLPWTPYSQTHYLVPIRILYLLAIWLHSYHHVPFRVIGAILSIVQLILSATNFHFDPSTVSASTLMTVHSHMSIEPSFQVLPICPTCQEVYPALDTTPALCTKCKHSNGTVPLFENNENTHTKEKSTKRHEPKMQFAFKSVSEQLRELLQEPRMEDLLDQWRKLPDRHPELGVYQDIFDGCVACSILGHDQSPFFRNEPEDRKMGPNGELHIGLTLGTDWQVFPFCHGWIEPKQAS